MAKKPAANMGACKLCGASGRLIDSHIIPKWAYRRALRLYGGMAGPNLVQMKHGRAMLLPTQLKEYLLCEDPCEKRTKRLADYACKISVQGDDRFPALETIRFLCGRPDAAVCDTSTLDVSTFVRFAVSVIWRASVSTKVPGVKLLNTPRASVNICIATKRPSLSMLGCAWSLYVQCRPFGTTATRGSHIHIGIKMGALSPHPRLLFVRYVVSPLRRLRRPDDARLNMPCPGAKGDCHGRKRSFQPNQRRGLLEATGCRSPCNTRDASLPSMPSPSDKERKPKAHAPKENRYPRFKGQQLSYAKMWVTRGEVDCGLRRRRGTLAGANPRSWFAPRRVRAGSLARRSDESGDRLHPVGRFRGDGRPGTTGVFGRQAYAEGASAFRHVVRGLADTRRLEAVNNTSSGFTWTLHC